MPSSSYSIESAFSNPSNKETRWVIYASCLAFICLFLCPHLASAQYLIEGKVDSNSIYKYASLDIINDWDAFQSVSDELVIKTVPIHTDGTYIFQGNELSDKDGFYRVRYSESNVGVSIDYYDRNFSTFIFSNDDTIQVENISFISNRQDNQLLKKYIEKNFLIIKNSSIDDTELQNKMLLSKHQDYCKTEINNSDHGLLNVYNLFSGSFELKEDADLFKKVQAELNSQKYRSQYHDSLSKHVYLHRYESESNQAMWLKGLLLLSVIANVVLCFFLFKWRRSQTKSKASSRLTALTNKELEVLQLIKDKKTNKQIASTLFVSEATIKTHINNIYRKLNVNSRQEAQKHL